MPLGRDQIIFQDARSFCQLASKLCDKTTVIHVMAKEVDTYKSQDPFADSVLNKQGVIQEFWGGSKMKCDHDFDKALRKSSWGSVYSIHIILS